MRGKMFLFVLLLLLTQTMLWSVGAWAGDRDGRPLVVAVLLYSKTNLPVLDGLKEGLRERGYVEGQGVQYVFHGVVERQEDLGGAMEKLMAAKPDLVYAAPTPAAQAAQKLCRDQNIPVLFGPVNDAVGVGLVKDRKHPGGNISGVMLADSEGKRLQLSMEIAPRIKSVLVPYNPSDKSSLLSLESVRQAASDLGLRLVARAVADQAAIDALLAHFPEEVDSIFLPRDAMIMGRIKDFAKLAIKKKVLLSSTRIEQVDDGALLGYGFDGFALGKQLARLAELIFQGKKPGDLPVETAEDYLAINLKTARAIDLPLDERLLRLAHRVVRLEE